MKKQITSSLLVMATAASSVVMASQAPDPSIDLAEYYEDDVYYDDYYWDECYDDYGNYYCDEEDEYYEEDESYYEEPEWIPAGSEDGEFTDVKTTDWFYTAVTTLYDEGVVSGYKDGNGNPTGEYGPSGTLTRGQMLKIVLEVGGYGAANYASADSTDNGQWYEGYVAMKEEMGLSLTGPWNEPITRREVAVLMSEAYLLWDYGYEYEGQFADISMNDRDADDLAAVYEFGIFTGDSGTGNFRPNDYMNRAEAAKVAYVAMFDVLE